MDDPVTIWIEQLRVADAAAAASLWNHFASRLHAAARKKLRPKTRPLYDEEDAAQSAFHSVCAGLAAGRFPDLTDRDSLLRLLLVITARKIARRHQYDQRRQRDVRRNLASFIFVDVSENALAGPTKNLRSREPTPEFAAEFTETCELLLQDLDDKQLQEIVALRLQGYTDAEVAGQLNCSRRTVQRSLEIIRRRWNRLEGGDE